MTKKILEKLVQKTLKDLKGNWIIIGGSVLPLVGVEYRSTVDIDMIPMSESGNDSVLDLMRLAEGLGLPVESVNSAGLFFLKKIHDWEERIVLHQESKKCRIYRPQFDLYLELKISRLSESDETDIIAYHQWHQSNGLSIERKACQKILHREVQKTKDSDRKTRLTELIHTLKLEA